MGEKKIIIALLFYTVYCSLQITIRMIKLWKMRWAGHVPQMGEKRYTYRILVGKSEGKRPLGRPRCRWVDNIKIDLRDRMG
jgi:hypothetical protein